MSRKVAISKRKKVDYRFKILYAIGMVLVVSGHASSTGIDLLKDWFPYYGFHLGIFLFASGYFYKIKYEKDIGNYILKKVKSLIVPLLLWNLFYAGFVVILSSKGFSIGMPVTLEKLTTLVFTHGQQFGYNLGGWFVIPLFMIQVFNVLVRKVLTKWKWKHREWLLFLVFLGLGVMGVWLSGLGPLWRSGWRLMLVRMVSMMPFFELGVLYREKLEKYDKAKNWIYFSAILLAQIIIVIAFRKNPTYVFAWGQISEYGLIMPYVSGAIGIALWLRVAKILEPAIGRSKIINLIADNSFSIMIHQFFGFWLVNAFFGLLSKFFLLTKPFSWEKYKTTVWYHYVPFGMLRFEILYLVAGLFVPILIQKVVNKIIEWLVKKRVKNSSRTSCS